MNSPFQSLNLKPELSTVLEELALTEMTPIQTLAIPAILAGRDVIGESQTGSGKTLSFALPILQKLELKERTVQALVICPTRELSAQVAREIRKFGRKFQGLQIAILSGGQPGREQAEILDQGAQIAVGTPGRILDLLKRESLNLLSLRTLVLDEADKMLEMGFQDEMNQIFRNLPGNRQTLLFSATISEDIQNLSKNLQSEPQHIQVADNEKNLLQEFVYEYENDEKKNTLMRALKAHPSKATLIFCNQKATVDELAESLAEQNVSVAALHGDLEQRDRDSVTSLFRNQSLRILVATDVAARGLDIASIELVINYDLPLTPETYVHRIGRTGRMGKAGTAVTIAKPLDALKLFAVEKFTGRKLQRQALGFKNQHGLSNLEGQAEMQTLLISGGRKHKIRAGDILGALTGEAGGLAGTDVGKIEIHERHSFVAISNSKFQNAFDRLRDGRIKGQKFQVRKK